MSQKENVEAELDAQFSILKANNSDMTTPLVDQDGFPRADMDLYAVRHARRRIHELRNDLRDVMNEIEKALQVVYDPSTPVGEPSPGVSAAAVAQHAEAEDAEPLSAFARVDGVAPGSPAAEAVRSHHIPIREDSNVVVLQSLRREDLILKFGSLTRSSFAANSLQPLSDLVSVNENVSPGYFPSSCCLADFP